MSSATDRSSQPTEELAVLLAPLLDQLAAALAPRIAAALADHPAQQPAQHPSRRLLTLDELIAQLPAGKKPTTWKAWLYQRTRLGQIPGCSRIGGRLFFDPNETLPWLLHNQQSAPTADGLDVAAEQSLHVAPMHNRARGDN